MEPITAGPFSWWLPPGHVSLKGVLTPIDQAPTAFLVWTLFHASADRVLTEVAVELLRRKRDGIDQIGSITEARALRHAPPRCVCGGKGMFIVGKKTFCERCKRRGIHKLSSAYRSWQNQPAAVEGELGYRDEKRIRLDAQKHYEAVGRRRRGYK